MKEKLTDSEKQKIVSELNRRIPNLVWSDVPSEEFHYFRWIF